MCQSPTRQRAVSTRVPAVTQCCTVNVSVERNEKEDRWNGRGMGWQQSPNLAIIFPNNLSPAKNLLDIIEHGTSMEHGCWNMDLLNIQGMKNLAGIF